MGEMGKIIPIIAVIALMFMSGCVANIWTSDGRSAGSKFTSNDKTLAFDERVTSNGTTIIYLHHNDLTFYELNLTASGNDLWSGNYLFSAGIDINRLSVSPDGSMLVFDEWNFGPTNDVYVAPSLDGSGWGWVMTGNTPFWADDGYIYYGEPSSGIWKMLPDGSGATQVLSNVSYDGIDFTDLKYPSVTSDNKLLFQVGGCTNPRDDIGNYFADICKLDGADYYGNIWIANLDGTNPIPLTDENRSMDPMEENGVIFYSYSPFTDNSTCIGAGEYSGFDTDAELCFGIWRMNIDGSGKTMITEGDLTMTEQRSDFVPMYVNDENRAPVASAELIPNIPSPGDAVQGFCSAIDADNNSVIYAYKIYKNNVLISEGESSIYPQGIPANVANVPSDLVTGGSSISLSCMATDGLANSSWSEKSIAVSGTQVVSASAEPTFRIPCGIVAGQSKQFNLGVGDVIECVIKGKSHEIRLAEILDVNNLAQFEVASPLRVGVAKNEAKEFDVDGNNINDTKISIHEVIFPNSVRMTLSLLVEEAPKPIVIPAPAMLLPAIKQFVGPPYVLFALIVIIIVTIIVAGYRRYTATRLPRARTVQEFKKPKAVPRLVIREMPKHPSAGLIQSKQIELQKKVEKMRKELELRPENYMVRHVPAMAKPKKLEFGKAKRKLKASSKRQLERNLKSLEKELKKKK